MMSVRTISLAASHNPSIPSLLDEDRSLVQRKCVYESKEGQPFSPS